MSYVFFFYEITKKLFNYCVGRECVWYTSKEVLYYIILCKRRWDIDGIEKLHWFAFHLSVESFETVKSVNGTNSQGISWKHMLRRSTYYWNRFPVHEYNNIELENKCMPTPASQVPYETCTWLRLYSSFDF